MELERETDERLQSAIHSDKEDSSDDNECDEEDAIDIFQVEGKEE